MSKLDYEYKILFLGDSTVGKTSLLVRYVDDCYKPGQPTVGIDVRYKYLEKDNKQIKLNIWDTAGQERFQGLSKNYLNGADGVIFVVDTTKEKTFEDLKSIIKNIKPELSPEAAMIIVENKTDLIDYSEVSKEELEKYANENNMQIFSASAKTGEGVEEFFNALIEKLINNKNIGIAKPDEDIESNFKLDRKTTAKKKKCFC